MVRLIKVNPSNEQYYSKEFVRGFNLGAQRQYEADIADMPTWIPCNERIPKEDGYYLVKLSFEWGNDIEMGWLLDGEWVNPNSHVTVAWMPLPEP